MNESPPVTTCSVCGGTGRITREITVPVCNQCQNCAGAGFLVADSSGAYGCRDCGGLGFVAATDTRLEMEPCPACVQSRHA
jgi:DnaJ-class molecular chaperone